MLSTFDEFADREGRPSDRRSDLSAGRRREAGSGHVFAPLSATRGGPARAAQRVRRNPAGSGSLPEIGPNVAKTSLTEVVRPIWIYRLKLRISHGV